jgi:hypothetical protein
VTKGPSSATNLLEESLAKEKWTMNDYAADQELPVTDELLVLDEASGDGLHVREAALTEFGVAIDSSLETLVARWAPYASPRAQREAASWRR